MVNRFGNPRPATQVVVWNNYFHETIPSHKLPLLNRVSNFKTPKTEDVDEEEKSGSDL